MLELLSAPFVQLAALTAFILAGMHAYLGFHVVSRGVIFVDLSLAQAAAFGSAVALTLGWNEHSLEAYLLALGFTLLAAGIISLARLESERVPQEAFIGIIYGAFTAGVILALSRLPQGAEHLNHLLTGSLLTVTPQQIMKIAALYALIGGFHFALRKPFILISTNRAVALAQGWKVRFWDFLFYASFGIVVTSSVEVAGVMVVFALLVLPSATAHLLAKSLKVRLLLGWVVGCSGVMLGVIGAIRFDLPVGASIIVALVLILVVLLPLARSA